VTVSDANRVDLRVVELRSNRSWGILVRRFSWAITSEATHRLIHDAS
jgi:hypothetical protein